MMTETISKMFKESFKKEWYETYWAIDLHGTIIERTYKDKDAPIVYYPYAKEVLQILSKRPDIKLILWTSSYPEEIVKYRLQFLKDDINFDCINENPDISSRNGNFGFYDRKFYFNILIDDKAGFNPVEWKEIWQYLVQCEIDSYLPDAKWTTKY